MYYITPVHFICQELFVDIIRHIRSNLSTYQYFKDLKMFEFQNIFIFYCPKKQLHIIVEIIIPVTSPISAAPNIPLVFFILTLPVYTAIVYKVVSVDPMITDANIPIKESTPYVFIISVATAIDALPEIGLNIASGKISPGI